jgi:uncharacterized protein YjbJ (UPF0337 family)
MASPLPLLANSADLRSEKHDQIKGNWQQLKSEIKGKWGKMTDDDLMEAEGDMDKLAGKIRQRTGDRREDLRKWLDDRQ